MSGYRESARERVGEGETRTWTSEHRCPDCGIALYAAERDGIRIDACALCAGVWLANEDAQRSLARRTDQAARLAAVAEHARGAGAEDAQAKAAERRPGERRCVVCAAPLVRSGMVGVWVDACAAHGTWFDAFEIGRVLRALGIAPPLLEPVTDELLREHLALREAEQAEARRALYAEMRETRARAAREGLYRLLGWR